MKIVSVNLSLSAQLKDLGHEILEIKPAPGIFSLSTHPELKDFNPDAIIQQETLGQRILLKGLEAFSCLKVYWSIDTHLNFFWHRFYGRNFDLVLTTQNSWVQKLENACHNTCNWLPWYGQKKNWSPWSSRTENISFVGRITEHRQTRKWMAQFLEQNFQARIAQDLSFSQMLDLYSQTRMVPNESIAGEINFRLFEAASCGTLVLNQKILEGIEQLYIPDREIIIFEHVLELQDKLNYFLKNTEAARKIAFNAWTATSQKHLAAHRAMKLENLLTASSGKNASQACHKNLCLAIFELWDCGRFKISRDRINEMLFSIPLDEDVLNAIIRFYHGRQEKIIDLLVPILQQKQYDQDLMVNQSCSAAALVIDHFDLAVQFWKRHLFRNKMAFVPPESPLHLYLLWAKELTRHGIRFRQGFMLDLETHLPQSALECLVIASKMSPEDKDILMKIKRIVQDQPGLESLVLKILSFNSLRDRHNWRWNHDLAIFHFRGFRMRQGLEELFLGLDNARKTGEDELFRKMVELRDPKGYMLKYLEL